MFKLKSRIQQFLRFQPKLPSISVAEAIEVVKKLNDHATPFEDLWDHAVQAEFDPKWVKNSGIFEGAVWATVNRLTKFTHEGRRCIIVPLLDVCTNWVIFEVHSGNGIELAMEYAKIKTNPTILPGTEIVHYIADSEEFEKLVEEIFNKILSARFYQYQ